MNQITLEDHLLNAMASLTREEMKPLLENIELNLTEKFYKTEESFQASNFAQRVVSVYGGIYNSIKNKMDDKNNQKSKHEKEFLRAYRTYVACEGTLDLLSKEGGKNRLLNRSIDRTPINFNLVLTSTDKTTLLDSVKHYYNFILNSSSPNHVKDNTKLYFEFLSNYVREKMNGPIVSKFRDNYKNITIIGKNFRIEGIKESKRNMDESKQNSRLSNENFKKGLEEVMLDPVKRGDIVGNIEGINLVETEIPCLMHYDLVEKRTPFSGFHQYIMFVGKSGTGKTMLARYAMAFAKEIATKNKKPLSLVKLNFENRWQYGPLEDIRSQFTEISEGNRIYIVFLDELDTKIPSRANGSIEGHKNDIIGEFLRFRGGGDYPNKENYIFIATCNEPKKVDPAILRVFKIQELSGPKTTEEKLRVLYNNLLPGIEQGYVQINDWETIGTFLSKHELMGGDLVNIADDAKERYRSMAGKMGDDAYGIRATHTENRARNVLSKNSSSFVTYDNDLIKSILKQAEKEKTTQKSYLF